MDRRTLVLGLVLLFSAFVIGASSWNGSYSGLGAVNTTTHRVVIAPNSLILSQVTLNSSNIFLVTYNSSSVPINLYVVNQSAFSSLQPYISSGNLSPGIAETLSGNGLLMESSNLSSLEGIVSYPSNSVGYPLPVSPGTYYLIYQNTGNAYANTTYVTEIPTSGILSGNVQKAFGIQPVDVFAALILLVGLILIIISLTRSGKKSSGAAASREEEIARIYRSIGERRQGRKSSGRNTKSGKRRPHIRRRR